MALASRQVATNAVTAVPLLVQGSGASQFKNIAGSIQDPLPIIIQNNSAILIYIGGPDVTTSNGFPLAAGQSLPMALYGTSEIPYAIAASATPSISILAGRQ
jgi:hypothetical protein